MRDAIPQHVDEAFLNWFRKQTEAAWQRYHTRTFDEFVASRVGGRDWQQGTRWLGGLNEQEIVTIEQEYQVRFPPDYRLFLQVLHSVDRPLVGAKYRDSKTMIPITAPSFYHWQKDAEALRAAYEWLVDGLMFDVEYNAMWPPSWGEKPETAEAQKACVQELVNAAPRMIPVIGHRYLLADPCEADNPVFSIYQSDIIIYGVNLHDFLLTEFGVLIGVDHPYSTQLMPERFEAYQKIPFWGAFL